MSKQRLLYAAARGARLQSRAFGEWATVSLADAFSDQIWNLHQRIHPEDNELQYGIFSTEIRKMVYNAAERSKYLDFAFKEIREYEENWIFEFKDIEHREFFLLLMSEILADEGL